MATSTPSVTVPPTSTSSPTSSSPTTSPTSTTSTTSSSGTTTSSTTSSTSSASSSQSSSSSTTTSSSTSTTSTTTATPVTSQFVSTSDGIAITTEVITSVPTTTSNPQNDSSSSSFFSNTKDVAAVFSVVGVVVLIIIIVFIVNAVRRRRAKKFDRDVAEAAAEAVANSRSPFDDYSYPNTGGNGGSGGGSGGGGGGGGGYGYSENSHGTYQTPPLQPNDGYGMTEMAQYDPYAAGAASLAAAAAVDRSRTRKESEPGTPGIAGVGARGLVREPSRRAPYHAFAGPAPHDVQGGGSGMLRSPRGTNLDVLDAVGLSGPGAGAPMNAVTNGAYISRRVSEATSQSTHHTQLSGGGSGVRSPFGTVSSGHQHPTPLQPGPQRRDSRSPDPFLAVYPVLPSVSTTELPNPHEATLPSPSLPGHQSDHNDDGDLSSSAALHGEEQRMSYQDDADYSQGNRVLRVANE